jgi:hypothetical protein
MRLKALLVLLPLHDSLDPSLACCPCPCLPLAQTRTNRPAGNRGSGRHLFLTPRSPSVKEDTLTSLPNTCPPHHPNPRAVSVHYPGALLRPKEKRRMHRGMRCAATPWRRGWARRTHTHTRTRTHTHAHAHTRLGGEEGRDAHTRTRPPARTHAHTHTHTRTHLGGEKGRDARGGRRSRLPPRRRHCNYARLSAASAGPGRASGRRPRRYITCGQPNVRALEK